MRLSVMTVCKEKEDYYQHLSALGGFPDGFYSMVTSLTFVPAERDTECRMNIAALLLDEPSTSFAGVFTRNEACGAPVKIGRKRLERKTMRGVLVNNRISNVAVKDGMETAGILCTRAGELFGIDGEGIFPSSTGIIGWRLPLNEMLHALPNLLSSTQRTVIHFAEAIMTTDRYPKIRARTLGQGKIMAVAKGAGMIEPNMATMLVFIMTDIDIEREELRNILRDVAHTTFNTISVDGDQSTSDMALAFSSRKHRASLSEFKRALQELCEEVSMDIVRNGEGTAHVMRIEVGGNPNGALCRSLAKAAANSPLVKTAIYGNDPNVGRILAAIGDQAAAEGYSLNTRNLSIRIGEETVFHSGSFDMLKDREENLTAYLKAQSQDPQIRGYPQNNCLVHIVIDLGDDKNAPFQKVFASDLGHEYVSENADYRS